MDEWWVCYKWWALCQMAKNLRVDNSIQKQTNHCSRMRRWMLFKIVNWKLTQSLMFFLPKICSCKLTLSKYSRSNLNTYIGMRGPESKGEKTHNVIVHYANGGMRPALVDALTFAGMANDNLWLRYYHDILRLEKDLQAEIPSEFRCFPPHLNHSRFWLISTK